MLNPGAAKLRYALRKTKFALLLVRMHLFRIVIAALIFFAALILSSCSKQERPLTPEQIQAKADSIFRIKLKKLQQEAKEDLERRMAIEVKPKADSIRNVKNNIAEPPEIRADGIEERPADTSLGEVIEN